MERFFSPIYFPSIIIAIEIEGAYVLGGEAYVEGEHTAVVGGTLGADERTHPVEQVCFIRNDGYSSQGFLLEIVELCGDTPHRIAPGSPACVVHQKKKLKIKTERVPKNSKNILVISASKKY